MKVLLTGATGFIGTAIHRELEGRGMQVIAVGGPCSSNSDVLSCDIADPESVLKLRSVGNLDAVVHAAGLAHRFEGGDDEDFRRVNVEGVKNAAELAGSLNAKRFVLLSSVLVYGSAAAESPTPIAEDHACKPDDVYGESKLYGEKAAREVCEKHATSLTIFRLVPTIGEGSKGNFAKLVSAVERGRFIWVGDGSNKKSMIYVGDVARAVRAVLKSESEGFSVFNLSAAPISMKALVGVVSKRLGRDIPKTRIPASPVLFAVTSLGRLPLGKRFSRLSGTVSKWLSSEVYSTAKIEQELGFKAKTSIELAAEKDVNYYLRNDSANRRN